MSFLLALLDASSPPQIETVATGVIPVVAGQRAASPLRKHKRKAAQPHRSALDTGSEASVGSADDLEVESRPKERRGSASPPAVPRQARPQRAAAAHSLVQPPALDAVAAPAPDQLAAVLDSSALPPFLAAATAAGPTAAKFCVQCGTTVTPMWRSVNGLTYCNADGLRLKRRLGLL